MAGKDSLALFSAAVIGCALRRGLPAALPRSSPGILAVARAISPAVRPTILLIAALPIGWRVALYRHFDSVLKLLKSLDGDRLARLQPGDRGRIRVGGSDGDGADRGGLIGLDDVD